MWVDSSSESGESEYPDDASMLVVQYNANVFDVLFSFMEKLDNEVKVTLLDLQQNLNTYSFRRLRNLDSALIDSFIELTIEKDSMNNSIDILSNERTLMIVQIEEQLLALELENLKLKNQLNLMVEKYQKKKGEVTGLQENLEANLNTV